MKSLTPPTHAQILVISTGTSDPSTTRVLADRVAHEVISTGTQHQLVVQASVLELREIATELSQASSSGFVSNTLRETFSRVSQADALIVATPVYKASYSGLFKMFFDLLDDDALLNMPVLLAATAGTPRHALVPDVLMRPLFAYLRALPVPTAIFAATEDWGSGEDALTPRIRRAAHELLVQVQQQTRQRVLAHIGQQYDRSMTLAAEGEQGEDTFADLDFDTDLMRLATGGSSHE